MRELWDFICTVLVLLTSQISMTRLGIILFNGEKRNRKTIYLVGLSNLGTAAPFGMFPLK